MLKKAPQFNFRPLFIAAIFEAIGIGIGGIILKSASGAAVLTASLLLALTVIFFISSAKDKRLIITAAVAFTVGICAIVISYRVNYAKAEYVEPRKITGIIYDVSPEQGGTTSYMLRDVTVNGENDIKGNVKLRLHKGYSVYSAGDRIYIDDNIKLTPDSPEFELFSFYQDSGGYTLAEIDNKQWLQIDVIDKVKLKVNERWRDTVRKLIYEKMPEREAGVVVALTIGDKNGIYYEDKDNAIAAGVYHIFALSGLHVSFLAAGLFFLLKRLKVNAIVRYCILIPLIVFYVFVAFYPFSLIRAAIMLAVSLLAFMLKRKSDPLSTLSFAVIAILTFCPFALYSLGLSLSVLAVLGIALFYTSFSKGLSVKERKSKPLNLVTDSAALSLSANSLSVCVMAEVFGTFPVYFIIANIIAVPLASVLFSVSAVTVLFTLLFPQTGGILALTQVVTDVFISFNMGIASLPNPLKSINGLGVFSFVYLINAFILSRYTVWSKKSKLMFSAVSVIIMLVGLSFTISGVLSGS
ncbi:MAG: ComEC/Rec2 family competence protein [Christensenellaceae bacterium]|nr:ComEC/Rec2 family competence protein [Christensenellaceae bacterium]